MRNEEDLNPAEKALESALGQLKPVTNTLNRDRLMFNAGRAMAGGKGRWQMLSGVLTVLLIGSVLTRPNLNERPELAAPVEPPRLEIAQSADHPVQVETDGSLDYITLRRNVVEHGLDALPLHRSSAVGEQNESRRNMLESLLSS